MLSKLQLVLFLAVFASVAQADLTVYPTGALNPRIPVVPTATGGAKGKAVPVEKTLFSYQLSPHLAPTTEGNLTLFLRANPRRAAATLLSLTDPQGRSLQIQTTSAAQGRELQLAFATAKAQSSQLESIPYGKWISASLNWKSGNAILEANGKRTELKIPADFAPSGLTCQPWTVDELKLTMGSGTFQLDWESNYSGRLIPNGPGGITARHFGFDTFVVGTDTNSRDCPMLHLTNSTPEAKTITVNYHLNSEVSKLSKDWQEQIKVPAKSQVMKAISFPVALQTDVYHLQTTLTGLDQQQLPRRNFMYVERRKVPSGPGKFGLHDCDVRQFGFWPDALPLRYCHNYLRWGYVVGPAWVKDWDGRYGLDPETPEAEWNWPAKVDWNIAAGRKMYVSVQCYPYGNWYRSRPYSSGMKKYPWGQGGGFPKLDYYTKFLDAAARRYKGKVLLWEAENEPNATGHMPRHPEDYAMVYQTVKNTVQSVSPEAKVFGICGTSTFVPWMKKVLATNAGKSMDAISWHTYTTPRQPDEAGMPEMLAEATASAPKVKDFFNSETGVLCVRRYEAAEPIPPQTVAAKIKDKAPGFVSRSAWPGKVNDEWQASSSIVRNSVLNFLAGAKAYIFFGWNPQWPKQPENWTKARPTFAILSNGMNGERTPSLYTLAVGVLTTQLEGVDLGKPYRPINTGGIRGGIFSTASGSQTAVFWAKSPRETALLRTTAKELEVVSTFGQSSSVHTVNGTAAVELTGMPIYIHSPQADLEIQPSPVKTIPKAELVGGKGAIDFVLVNHADQNWLTSITPIAIPEVITTPAIVKTEVRGRRHRQAIFSCQLNGKPKATTFWQPFKIKLPSGEDFICSVQIDNRPMVEPVHIPDTTTQPGLQISSVSGKPIDLNRTEQAVIGGPSKLASLQEDYFWNGPEELSSQVWLGYNKKGLFITAKVHDAHPKLPARWPGIHGACLELFLDFRSRQDGLGTPHYGKGVYQFLVQPAIAADQQPKLFSPQLADLAATGLSVASTPLGPKDYWVSIFVPWTLASPNGKAQKEFGFDLGVNGSYPDKAKRKTQLMLFGTAQNSRNASGFARAIIPTDEK